MIPEITVTDEHKEFLRTLIDTYAVYNVVGTILEICDERASEDFSIKLWQRIGNILFTAYSKLKREETE